MKIKFLTVLMLAFALTMSACWGKSDKDLVNEVGKKLQDASINGVSVNASSGVVTLSGEVADIAVKNKAEELAKSVEGVKSVTNSLSLKPLPSATPAAADPALTGKINEALKKAGITGLTVTVKDGKVTVTGDVPKALQQKFMQAIQESGVIGVDTKGVNYK